MQQAEINIGLVGHVDHGKTSLTKALTGKWTDTHSEELKRGITIRVGYADTSFYKSKKDGHYIAEHQILKGKKSDYTLLRHVSFLDAPGHETLMATMISAANILDAALLIIAANETCPQAQTAEHLMVLNILGIKNIIIVQNKVDLVSKEAALKNYNQIKEFLKGTVAESAPIIPISANYNANIDILIEAIETHLKTPKRDLTASPKMYIARSFDINKPGQKISELHGGVLGGSVIQGKIKTGDNLLLRPGLLKKDEKKTTFVPIDVEVVRINCAYGKINEAIPGGLIAIETKLDPAVVKGDLLVGQVVGSEDAMGEVVDELTLEYTIIKRKDFDNPLLKANEAMVVSIGTATSIGMITKLKGKTVTLRLKRAIYAQKGDKVALSRRVKQRWRLSVFATVK